MAEVGVLVYDGMEVLDCCGPFEVFSTASRVALRHGWATTPFTVHTAAENACVTASVCTGAFLLATAGLLDGRAATSHWEDVDELERRFPEVSVRRGTRWVDEGRVVTSAGISAGIDMSLHLVRRTEGEELARATAHQMDYEWRSAE